MAGTDGRWCGHERRQGAQGRERRAEEDARGPRGQAGPVEVGARRGPQGRARRGAGAQRQDAAPVPPQVRLTGGRPRSRVRTFDELQAGLGATLPLNTPGATTEHVLVVLPSFSFGESLLAHYGDRIPALEHRYLVALLVLNRIERCEMVLVLCEAPDQEVLEYYVSLIGEERRDAARTN